MNDIINLQERARKVLEGNVFSSETFFYTCPSLDQYTHQWLWDSCFHAIIWSYFNPENAKKELLSLIKKQFDNGMLPHMCYWKSAVGLIPRIGDFLFKNWPEKDRSRITQPPLIAQAVEKVYAQTQDQAFLERMIIPLQKYYDWLHTERNEKVSGDGLVSIIHPWESGMDLLPIWDHIHKIKRLFTIRTALWLNKIIKKCNQVNWEIAKIRELDLFLVKDVSFNAIYLLNLQVMANLCGLLDQKEKKEIYLQRAEEGKKTLLEKCWDEETGFFHSIHALSDQKLPEITISGLFPLILDLDTQKLDRLVKAHLLNEKEFWLPYPVPSVAKSSPYFTPKGGTLLWRGPTWFSPNWYIVKGLQSNGYEDIAQEIITKMIEMVHISGFREQYDPFTAKGYGARNFGWSTLLIDLL